MRSSRASTRRVVVAAEAGGRRICVYHVNVSRRLSTSNMTSSWGTRLAWCFRSV